MNMKSLKNEKKIPHHFKNFNTKNIMSILIKILSLLQQGVQTDLRIGIHLKTA